MIQERTHSNASPSPAQSLSTLPNDTDLHPSCDADHEPWTAIRSRLTCHLVTWLSRTVWFYPLVQYYLYCSFARGSDQSSLTCMFTGITDISVLFSRNPCFFKDASSYRNTVSAKMKVRLPCFCLVGFFPPKFFVVSILTFS